MQQIGTDKAPGQCPRWATSTVEGQGYCDVHSYERLVAAREAAKLAAKNKAFDDWIEFTRQFPSVWDRDRASFESWKATRT